ncbi:MAG TPA: amidohydrolase [Gemmatimonadaceae bacterium]|nr:amidohydrolase [Gemmatimonadaceae bacterium]
MNRLGVWRLPCALVLLCAPTVRAQRSPTSLSAEVQAVYARAEALYLDLHRHPELSFHETETSAKIATELKQLGFDVTTGVGRTGVVAVLKNGAGPTVMLRTELDALPVTESTGLPYASTVRTKDDAGFDVGVMHACGHDVHMAALVSTARIMAGDRGRWRGTLVLIGQPAEETVSGAKAMIVDGLLTRFPRPDFVIAIHDDPRYPSGTIGYHAGPILANNESLTIHIYGRGGHGARPETTIDPIVIAARAVVTLQTIVSREISPMDAAVVTVGSIHGGTKHNIVPDEVTLQLTVRSFSDQIRQHLHSAIERIVKAEAAAGGATREPSFDWLQPINALVNDSALTQRIAGALERGLGADRVRNAPPEMGSEDLSEFPIAGVPTLMMRVGASTPAAVDAATKGGPALVSLHNANFFPDREPTLKAAIAAEVLALRELMPVVQP